MFQKVLQNYFISGSKVLQWCFMGVSWVCYKFDLGLFQECFMDVSWVFKGASWVFHGCLKGVLIVFYLHRSLCSYPSIRRACSKQPFVEHFHQNWQNFENSVPCLQRVLIWADYWSKSPWFRRNSRQLLHKGLALKIN